MMDDFEETIFRLDAAGQFQEVVDYAVKIGQRDEQIIFIIYRLFIAARFQSAYLLSKTLSAENFQHPLVFLSVGVGGLLFGNTSDEAAGLAGLRSAIDGMNAEQRESFYINIIYPASLPLMSSVVSTAGVGFTLRFLELMKAGVPLLRDIFDFSSETPVIDVAALRQRGRQRSRLLEFQSPPAGVPRTPRRAIVAMRNLVFPGDPKSRSFDGGPRICAAMNTYGWQATHFKMEWRPIEEDYKNIAAFCSQEKAEILILDDQVIELPTAHQPRNEMIQYLRQNFPSLKIVAMYLDSWSLPTEVLINASSMLDAVWTIAPTMSVWQHPVFAGKLFPAPVPHAGNYGQSKGPLPSRMAFIGGIKGYNWHRAFWKDAAERYELPIDWRLSEHKSDGLETLDSYADYIRRLTEAGSSINFSMRPNLSRVFTNRAFETINSGALLIEEETLDLDYYVVAGEHYLEFSSFSDLRALIRFIAERPEEAEAIRRAGNEYFLSRFNDDKIIGYLDHQLYYRDR
jgi:hypothetical protein